MHNKKQQISRKNMHRSGRNRGKGRHFHMATTKRS